MTSITFSLTNPDPREAYALAAYAAMCNLTGFESKANEVLKVLYADITALYMVITNNQSIGPFSKALAEQLVKELTELNIWAKVSEKELGV